MLMNCIGKETDWLSLCIPGPKPYTTESCSFHSNMSMVGIKAVALSRQRLARAFASVLQNLKNKTFTLKSRKGNCQYAKGQNQNDTVFHQYFQK